MTPAVRSAALMVLSLATVLAAAPDGTMVSIVMSFVVLVAFPAASVSTMDKVFSPCPKALMVAASKA